MATSAAESYAFLNDVSAPRSPRSAEVIVVGNGLTGLYATLKLQEAGVNCLLLESRNERDCFTDAGSSLLRNVDWVDRAKHPETSRLLKFLGFHLSGAEGLDSSPENRLGLGQSPSLCESDQRSLKRVRDNLQGLTQAFDVNSPSKLLPNYGSMSVHELVVSHGATEKVQKMANHWAMSIFGVSAKSVSAIYFLLVCKSWGGFEEVLSEMKRLDSSSPASSLSHSLYEGLSSRLRSGCTVFSQTVQQIDQTSSSKCVLTTTAGNTFYCTKVILALPAHSYQSIEFSPALSEDKQWLPTQTLDPCIVKTKLLFDQPWWQERNAVEMNESTHCVENTPREGVGMPSLTCIIGGELGRSLQKGPAEDMLAVILRELHTIYGTDIPTPTSTIEQGTSTPCLAVPATRLRNLERDQWQPEGHIHFTGADTSYSWKGHTEGALASACRGAQEVIDALCSDMTGIPVSRL
ncbi:putative flavin-containing monoamine oxidase C [Paramyrothecium foliicola]|nr:putative flavin-containing monoamine oxidase C [Paramyrothecium foliicola]